MSKSLWIIAAALWIIALEANARDVYVGEPQQSVLIVCDEVWQIEKLVYALESGEANEYQIILDSFIARHHCGEHFLEYTVLGVTQAYYRSIIFKLKHRRGIGYSWTNFNRIIELLELR
jgi:hypothetical protein